MRIGLQMREAAVGRSSDEGSPTSMLDNHSMIVGARMLRRRRFASGSPSSDSEGRFKGGAMVGRPGDLQHILPLQVLSKAIRVMNH